MRARKEKKEKGKKRKEKKRKRATSLTRLIDQKKEHLVTRRARVVGWPTFSLGPYLSLLLSAGLPFFFHSRPLLLPSVLRHPSSLSSTVCGRPRSLVEKSPLNDRGTTTHAPAKEKAFTLGIHRHGGTETPGATRALGKCHANVIYLREPKKQRVRGRPVVRCQSTVRSRSILSVYRPVLENSTALHSEQRESITADFGQIVLRFNINPFDAVLYFSRWAINKINFGSLL